MTPDCVLNGSDAALCWCQEEWLHHVSDMLAVNRTLLELRLGMAAMTDTGMERLSEGLKGNRALRYLDLRWYGNTLHIQKSGLHTVGAAYLAGFMHRVRL